MTHPHPPICLSREKLLGFRTHTEGPFYLRPKPGPLVECRSALLYRIYCLAGGQVASPLGRGQSRGQTKLCCSENGRFLVHPNLVLLLAGLGFGLFADARTHSGLGWLVAFEDSNGPDVENTCHLLWASHCAQHFPLIISVSFTSK